MYVVLPPKPCAIVPKQQLRPFYWTKLTDAAVSRSVWLDLDDVTAKLDVKRLEELFPNKTSASKKKAKVEVKETKSLLDNNRAKNLGIFMRSFPIPLDEIEENLNAIDGSGALELEHVIAMKRFQPSEEDREMYKNYKESKDKLQNEDQFLMKLCEIPLLQTRLDLLLTVREFPSNLGDFMPTIELASNACKELYECEDFSQVLSFLLSIGNYLNAGTKRGGAYGFQLNTLVKTFDYRSNSQPKVSLMHYLVEQIHCSKPDLLKFPNQMVHVSRASEISIDGILAELEVMKKQLDRIDKNAEMLMGKKEISSSTKQQLQTAVKEFLSQYREELSKAEGLGKNIKTTYSKILSKFGESTKMESEELFGTISKFLIQFTKVCKELYPPPKVSPKPTGGRIKVLPIIQPMPGSPDAVDGSAKNMLNGDVSKKQNRKFANTVPRKSDINDVKATEGLKTIKRAEIKPVDGYLEKLRTDGKHWDKRYFELELGQLIYQKEQGGKMKYGGTIGVSGCPVTMSQKSPLVIEIETAERTWQLRASSEQDARKWYEGLIEHSKASK